MSIFRNLSFRYRVPLNLSLVVLVTGLGIAAIVLWHDYRVFQQNADRSAEHLGQILSHALAPALEVDDTWQAYNTLKALFQVTSESWLRPDYAVVVDAAGVTLVSSDPLRFPLAIPAAAVGDNLALILEHAADMSTEGINLPLTGVTYRIEPILSGDIRLGTLVLSFSDARLWPHNYQVARQVLMATGLIMLVLLPLGWLFGRRLAAPLTEIESYVTQWTEQEGRQPINTPMKTRGNELERLVKRIQSVSEELAEKDWLEQQMVRSERQAALGRLAAGVAHEINNPLGGMFTAIATYKRHGQNPKVSEKTVSLLERGLEQIRQIVSALLVEVKNEPRDLSRQDIRDLAELLAPRAHEKQLQLAWPEDLPATLPLPAGPVRQVVMNLVLNAIQATPKKGTVTVEFEKQQTILTIRVANDGKPIPKERLARLFEPFIESDWGGNGLGLWITDQTVRQLHGRIQVFFENGRTVFQVELPLNPESEDSSVVLHQVEGEK